MRIKVVLHYVGMVISFVGFFMLLPIVCSLYYGERDWIAFTISIGITIGSGLLLWRFTPGGQQRLSLREGIAIVTVTWVLLAAFGALPYMLAGTFSNYLDGYFEAMSGFTATGATAITNIESQPHGILLWRGLTQWLTGMGILTLFVAIFPLVGMGAHQIVQSEMPTVASKRKCDSTYQRHGQISVDNLYSLLNLRVHIPVVSRIIPI